MNDEHNRLMNLFNEARAQGSVEARAAYLDAACGDDAALRHQVEALLAAHDQVGDFLEKTVQLSPPDFVTERPGTVIGRYKLLEQIGEGGFGVVFMAEQLEPIRRKVALKVIKPGMDTKQVIARFEAERQALALLDHPNIARIFDAGATETGRPYFVMELVHGVPLTHFCDANDLTPAERLQLFLSVCEAVQHAHQKGIIHRDLKPTNILVTLHDGKPVPKVIDFGTAKALQTPLTEKTLFTAYGKLIGTPAYMSPEQAELSGLDVDTRADIYSLGVLLYELLTGTTPFEGERLRAAAFEEMMRIIGQEEPPKPSTRVSTLGERAVEIAKHRQVEPGQLRRTLQGDLDWIVMKALEKDRGRRYETATSLAEDLQHHLNHEPVKAGPPGTVYRARKFVRRHRMGVALAASVSVALIAGLVASLIGFREARLERDHALAAERQAEQERDRAVAAEAQAEKQQARAELMAQQEAEQRQRAEAGEQKAQAEAAKSQQVARFLQDMLAGVGPSVARGRDTTMLREILDQTAERVGKDLSNQPEVKADLQYTMALVYGALSKYDRAQELHREALAIRRQLRGNEDADVAASLYGLAEAIEKNHAPDKAEPLYREALAIRRKLHGHEHLDVATLLTGLASALQFQRNYDQAEGLYREALAIQRKLLGKEHSAVAASLNSLGYTIALMGRLDEGEALVREALAMRRKLLPADHPDLAVSLSALAQILANQKKWAEAETLLREGLGMRRKVLGNEHDRVYRHRAFLGTVLLVQGKLEEAEATFREVLEAKGATLTTGDGTLAADYSIRGLTEVLQPQGRLGELVTLDANIQVLNRVARCLAASATRDGRLAILIAEKVVAMTGRKDPMFLDTLAAACAEAGQFTNAVNIQKEAIALLKSEEQQKDYESRLRLYEFGLPYRAILYWDWQIRRLLSEGKLAKAELLARECQAICESQKPDDSNTFLIRSLLGVSLLEQKKYAEAEPLLLSACEGLLTPKGKNPPSSQVRLREVLQQLVQLYEATDRPAQAAEWKQKLAEFEKGESEKPATPPP